VVCKLQESAKVWGILEAVEVLEALEVLGGLEAKEGLGEELAWFRIQKCRMTMVALSRMILGLFRTRQDHMKCRL
jgi:hypothetical protein